MNIKIHIKRLIPSLIWGWLHRLRLWYSIEKYQCRYSAITQRLRNKKEPLNVLFMAIYGSNWKYDSVYQLMLKDPMFNPIILVCPDVFRGREHMLNTLNQCCHFFEQKGYSYVKTYDEQTDSYIDAHVFNPDIIFYTSPYKIINDNRYFIENFQNSLFCYINYAFSNHNHEWGYNLQFHQQLWRYYVECNSNLSLITSSSLIKGKNCKVIGYPMYDAFISGTSNGYDWKNKDRKFKRVIWSPHHTVNMNDEIHYSTFLLYFDVMWKLAIKYKNKIQFVFKPHPLLRNALYNLEGWGKERTEQYYNKWADGENTAYSEGDYVDLFNSSDAMINDSGSFTIEYLYMHKPCLLLNNYNRRSDANEVSLQAINCWYLATESEQIEAFLLNVVLGGEDPMKEKREIFFNEELLPPNGVSVAENIINDIKTAIRK